MERYKYHIQDSSGTRVESNIPNEEQALTVINFLKDQNPSETYTIELEPYYIVTGLGRDPDLH